MKKFFFISLLLLLGLFYFSNGTSASMFPNDSKSAYLEITGNKTTELVLTKPSNSYSLLYLSTLTNTNELNARIRLYCGATTFLDISKAQVNTNVERYSSMVCTNDIYATTGNMNSSDRTSIRLIYLEYDLNTVPNLTNSGGTASTTIGTIGTTTMPTNIENIGYIATTTQLANGQTFTQGTYNLPFNLFIFMAVLFFAVMLIVVLSIYFIKTKKNDY